MKSFIWFVLGAVLLVSGIWLIRFSLAVADAEIAAGREPSQALYGIAWWYMAIPGLCIVLYQLTKLAVYITKPGSPARRIINWLESLIRRIFRRINGGLRFARKPARLQHHQHVWKQISSGRKDCDDPTCNMGLALIARDQETRKFPPYYWSIFSTREERDSEYDLNKERIRTGLIHT